MALYKEFLKAPARVRFVIIATITVTPVIRPKLNRLFMLANIKTKNPELNTMEVIRIALPLVCNVLRIASSTSLCMI